MFKTFNPSEAMLESMKARVSGCGDDVRPAIRPDPFPAHRLARAGVAICSPSRAQPTSSGEFLTRCLEVPHRRAEKPKLPLNAREEKPKPLHRSAREEKRRRIDAAVLRSLSSHSAKRGNSASSSLRRNTSPAAPRAFYSSPWTDGAPRPSARSTASSGSTARIRPHIDTARSLGESTRIRPHVDTARSLGESSARVRPRVDSTRSLGEASTVLVRPQVDIARLLSGGSTALVPALEVEPSERVSRVPGSSRSRSALTSVKEEDSHYAAPSRTIPSVASAPTLRLHAPYKFVANPVPAFAQCPANYSRKKVRLKDATVDCVTGKDNDAIAEAIEAQKMRLASKMEVIDFYAACQSRMQNMSQKHSDKLRRSLLECARDPEKVAKTVCMFGAERQKEMSTWAKASEDKSVVTKCLQRINAFIDEI